MNNASSYTEQIMDMIAKDQIKEAIQETQNLLKGSPQFYELTLQSARYSDVMKSIRMGMIDFSDASIEKNKIRFALIDMLRDLEESRQTNAAVQSEVQTYLEERAAIINNNTAEIKGNQNIIIQGGSDSQVNIQINKNPPKKDRD